MIHYKALVVGTLSRGSSMAHLPVSSSKYLFLDSFFEGPSRTCKTLTLSVKEEKPCIQDNM